MVSICLKLGKGNITIELVDDHKVEVHLEDELSDPIQPPFEVPDPPGSGIVLFLYMIFRPETKKSFK